MRMVYDEHTQDYVCYGDAPVFGVEEVEALPDYKLKLLFSNGERRIYDARGLFQYDLFAPLQNDVLFRQAYSDGCAVAWNDEIDIAPEALYRDSVPA